MSVGFARRFDALHREALAEAEEELADRGFQRNGDGRWQGALHLSQHGQLPATVQLPPRFPDALPDIFIDPRALPPAIPHIERSGRICLAPNTGTLLDASQPRGLVIAALERATDTLVNGLSGINADDISDEFEAYWADEHTDYIWSICDPSSPAHPITSVGLRQAGGTQVTHRLLAGSREAARIWAHRAGWRVEQAASGFFLPLAAPFLPPSSGHPITFSTVQQIVQQHATPETCQALQSWLATVTLPVVLLMALPLRGTQGVALVGIDVEAPRGETARQAQRGFRPGKVPAAHALRFQSDQSVKRLLIERLDSAFVLPRAGATTGIATNTIAVIGCGAVGSYVVSHLAALGVGQLRLIDPERLSSANIHRHVLGVSYIGFNKARGLACQIGHRFPHIRVEHRAKSIEEVLCEESAFITEADLVVVAIGDPTVELRLNDLLGAQQPRLHTWVEPLGLGGHILATGVAKRPGCYQCLYEQDETLGLINLASFAAPGQTFQRTMGGCAGQFVPFGMLDVDRIAGEAARLAIQILTGTEHDNVLVSVREDERTFRDSGYTLAPHARLVASGSRCRETSYARADCPICSRWTE